MAIPKGVQVRQIVTPIEGQVAGYSVDGETGDVQVLVQWVDGEGQPCSKYFKESELEVVPQA